MHSSQLHELLEEKYRQYNRLDFIELDPISIPHLFSLKEDIEISGFLTAIISWGNRKSILNNANRLMKLMDMAPYDFVLNHSDEELKKLQAFVHRTFNGIDLLSFISCLKSIYTNYDDLEHLFGGSQTLEEKLASFPNKFFCIEVPQRSFKHIAKIQKGSAAKRINMFLRWMVRSNETDVDFGIWNSISPRELYIPLDVHSGRIARELGLLERKQDDWKSVKILTQELRTFDPSDPVKYDFALFGMGIMP